MLSLFEDLLNLQLIVGNGALNSSAATITVTLWPLVDFPVVVDRTNTSFILNITPSSENTNLEQIGCVVSLCAMILYLIVSPPSIVLSC